MESGGIDDSWLFDMEPSQISPEKDNDTEQLMVMKHESQSSSELDRDLTSSMATNQPLKRELAHGSKLTI